VSLCVVCLFAALSMTSAAKETSFIAKTVLCSLLPLILITMIVMSLFWLYRQRSQRFFHHHRQQQQQQLCADNVVSPSSSLLGRSLNIPVSSHPDITLVEVKARGRFGSVWKAQRSGIDVVAVKVFPEHDRQSWLCEQRFYALPCTTNCANILQFIGAESRGVELWLVTEYHDVGSMYDYLKAHTVTFTELSSIALSMMNGLAFLHSDTNGKPSVAHRDIKSRNVLLRHDMTACIADFGLSLILGDQQPDAFAQVCYLLYHFYTVGHKNVPLYFGP